MGDNSLGTWTSRLTPSFSVVAGYSPRDLAVGVGIGLAGALWAGRWVKPLLFDVTPNDPVVSVVVAGVLVLVAIAASWHPALRASRVDPNVALRTE